MNRTLILLALAMFGTTFHLPAQKLIRHPDRTMGIRYLTPEASTWRGMTMHTPRMTENDLSPCGPDFFEYEYGQSCRFHRDILKEFGGKADAPYRIVNNAMEFNTGSKGFSFQFGSERGGLEESSIRFGTAWGPQMQFFCAAEFDLEQSVPETEWIFSYAEVSPSGRWGAFQSGKKFRIKGNGRFRVPLMNIGWRNFRIQGIKFTCATPNARIRLKSLRITPVAGDAFWRREFDLNFIPVKALLSWFNNTDTYELFINGKEVARGRNYLRSGMESFDIRPFLKRGRNVIAMHQKCNSPGTSLRLEAAAVGPNGETVFFSGGRDWKFSQIPPDSKWTSIGFDDSAWQTPRLGKAGIQRLPNGDLAFDGFNPLHMGPLDVKPEGQKYPVFDHDRPIRYTARIPDGIADPEIELRITDSDTGKLLESLTGKNGKKDGSFRAFSVEPKLREPGAYYLNWTLRSGKKVLDTRKDELIVAGPVKQDFLPLKEFEKNLESRLELVQKIDCTASAGNESFLDHSSQHSAPALNVGKVTEKNGIRRRETGKAMYDFLVWHLNLKREHLGQAMIAEVVIPADTPQYLYASVVESFPIPFANNGGELGSRGWPNASGCAFNGGLYPLERGTKTLRFVFFPASLNSCIMLQNGLSGIPSSVTKINIYRVRGGLPALQLPETGRYYGLHNERIVFTNWAGYRNAAEQGNYKEARVDSWINFYRAMERKIQWLRYQGHNTVVEGIYMYNSGDIPDRKFMVGTEFDRFHLLLKMYRHNGIRPFLGIEYLRGIDLSVEGLDNVSDRKIHRGEARGIYTVDRYGRQNIDYGGNGLNVFHPVVWNSLLYTVKAIYRNYDGIGDPLGLFMVNGRWWLPGFPANGQDSLDISYDDDTIEQFEKETGIHLNLPFRGRKRFADRHALLTTRYKTQWISWRNRKILEKQTQLREAVRRGKQKWNLALYMLPEYENPTPFDSDSASVKSRNEYVKTSRMKAGFPPENYRGKEGVIDFIGARSTKMTENNADLSVYGYNTSRSFQEIMRNSNALYLGCIGLNENIGSRIPAAKKWYWKANNVTVYDKKPLGDFAYADLLNTIREFTPKYILHGWIDVNVTTGHGDQNRRFVKAFYATPEVPFQLAENVTGIQCETSGPWLRLVNATAYPLTGVLESSGEFRDCVYDTVCSGKTTCRIRPYSILIFRSMTGKAEDIKGAFRFHPEREKEILLMGETILKEPSLKRKIKRENRKRLSEAWKRKNVYALQAEMDRFEVLNYAMKFFASAGAIKNQKRLEQMLESEGAARINAGADADYVDEDGNLWLPDQSYTGFNAYGNEYGIRVSRGKMAIRSTRAPEVFRSEIYGRQMFYHVPVPAGTYTVKLHIAETFTGNRESGRLITITVNGKKKKNLNPVVFSGGFATAGCVTWSGINAEDELITISMEGSPLLNGIEIRKEKTKK